MGSSSRLAVVASLVGVLAAGHALAAPRRAAVLLVPLDRSAGSAVVRFTEYLEGAVARRSDYALRDAASVLGNPAPTAAIEARKKVAAAVANGKKLFAERKYDDAESAFRTALIDVDSAVAAMDRCAEYCEALAYLAATQVNKNDEPGAREVLKHLLAVERSYRFDPALGKNVAGLLRDAQRAESMESLVNVTVQTSPSGGKVFLDGQYKGYAPLTIERVVAGRHLLRIERPGTITYGQLADVAATEEVTLKARLTPTPEFAALEASFEQIAAELDREGGEVLKLGPRLKTDRALVGTVKGGGGRFSVNLVLVDFGQRRVLAQKARTFQGEEFGEIEKEVQRFGNLILAEGDGGRPKVGDARDPLENRSGVEDWDEESAGSSPEDRPRDARPQKGGKKADLEGETGTGDW